MPQLVTDSDVKTILKTLVDTQPFIATAVVLMDTQLASAGYSLALATEIQKYLAAHIACMRDPRLLEQSTDQLRARFQRTSQGLGLDATEYGQMVKMLDTSGALAQAMDKRAFIRVD